MKSIFKTIYSLSTHYIVGDAITNPSNSRGEKVYSNHACGSLKEKFLEIPEGSSGFEISNWMHLSVGQVDCKNHLSQCQNLW